MQKKRFKGKTLSPGLGKGAAFIYRDSLARYDEFYDIDERQIEEESVRLEKALAAVLKKLAGQAEQVEKEMDEKLAGIFLAHHYMLNDESLLDEINHKIADDLVSAGSAVRAVFRRWEKRFRSQEAAVARQKGDDMRDLAQRLVAALAGERAHALEKMPEGAVLVANRLLPSDTVFLGRRKAAAALLEYGGTGSHAALFAREMNIPCITSIKGVVDKAESGQEVLVDADSAEVVFGPSKKDVEAFEGKRCRLAQIEDRARIRADEPAVAQDGMRIPVYANIGTREDAKIAMENGADGIGLYRIERIYLGRQEPPDQDTLFDEMRRTLDPARDCPVYVRLLDVGADKPLPYLEQQREGNPALGRRGIRFLLDHPDLFHAQLEVLMRLAEHFDLHVLVPMVTLPGDVLEVRRRLEDMAEKQDRSDMPKLGAMIETPAAALAAKELAEHVDFFSAGTNDLTQYALAADRENATVDEYYDDAHAALFSMLAMARKEIGDLPFSVCGELAGRIEHTAQLLECGVSALSVVPSMVGRVKQAVRESPGLPVR